MTTLFEQAWAKINLTLDVLGKRADGYHDLQSVMQTVSLCDDIVIELDTGLPWSLHCNDADIPCDERNLAWKAARLFLDTAGICVEGLRITITKRIPSQAGLGGGSSDAAAVLRMLNRHFGEPLSPEALAALSGQIGSDIPFCVMGGTVMAEGRGELLRPLPAMPECYIVICKPDFPVSTPVLYRKLDESVITRRPNNPAMEEALERGDLCDVADNVWNVFDPVVASEHPEIDRIKTLCHSCGAETAQMSGSGSAVFALFAGEEQANSAAQKLKKHYSLVFLAKPV